MASIRKLGVKAVAVQADASKPDFGDKIMDAVKVSFPSRKVDILVNNAGDVRFQPDTSTWTLEDFDASFHANVRGPLLLTRAVLPHMTSPGGRIINTGSSVATMGTKYAGIYAATKAAVHSLTKSMADDLGERGITVNSVAPGPTQTAIAPPEGHLLVGKFRAMQHVKRNGDVKEIAEVVAFLASEGSSFVTGQVWYADGGLIHRS